MKNIIFLIIRTLLCVEMIWCNNVILSKFYQSGYKVKNVRIQLMSYDKNVFNIFEIKTFKYNRTTTAHNGTANLKVSTKDKAEIRIQAYKFLSNEYRHFPVRFQVNLKKAFDANIIGLRTAQRCGNLTTFEFYKDTSYHICNFVIDESYLPPLVPNGMYQVECTILYLEQEIALVHLYGEVYVPIKYPKK